MVSNAGITMARMGMRVAAHSAVGDDRWGHLVRAEYQREGIDPRGIDQRGDWPTSVTVVMVDAAGRRSFVHSQGAPKAMDKADYLGALELFASSRAMLLGYYPLLPRLLDDLAEVLQAIRQTGCLTALDAAGGGGSMDPLRELLPHLDVYCPSLHEAQRQTGQREPRRILEGYRAAGADGFLGVKLGAEGALLSPAAGSWVTIPPVVPPGKVVDTTGAGDAFFAGLLTGLLRGDSPFDAGRLAAAAGARSVTAAGATTAAADLAGNRGLAGLA